MVILILYYNLIPVYKAENTAIGIRHADHVAPRYPQKLALTSPTSGGRSVGIVRSRTQDMEFSFFYYNLSNFANKTIIVQI
jgi:hypothetical protein